MKSFLTKLTALPHPDSNIAYYRLITDPPTSSRQHYIRLSITIRFLLFLFVFLSENKMKWSTYECELLTACLATLHSKLQIEGRHMIFTEPVAPVFKKTTLIKQDNKVVREYIGDILCIPGENNISLLTAFQSQHNLEFPSEC